MITKSAPRKCAVTSRDIWYIVKYQYICLSIRPPFFMNTGYRLLVRVPDADAAIYVCSELLWSVECTAKETSNRIIVMCSAWSFRFIYETLVRLIYNSIIDTLIDAHIYHIGRTVHYRIYHWKIVSKRHGRYTEYIAQ